jgi:endonuclease/exonuclease/phosphatase family metal-dependent hydrolase/glycosyltransferase involved in cell wall biosynthesis
MLTNTYTPIVGGIEESIRSFTNQLRGKGHSVIIAAPEMAGSPPFEEGVIRLPAIQNFNQTDFSVNLPMPGILSTLMKKFKPEIVHSHHPFLMGDLALRLCGQYRIPLIFTYHTMYEQYVHYLPIHNDAVKRFVIELAAGYANLSHQVIVPSESVRDILLERGVQTPMEVIPTGIHIKRFKAGEGDIIRQRFLIPANAFVIGTVGRLEPEKNLEFLVESVAALLKKELRAHFLVIGRGSCEEMIKKTFETHRLTHRLHFAGVLQGQDLVDAYHAMDIFAFTSLSETQGIVLVEAMAAGVPVVALDAPGAREVVVDYDNGRLLLNPSQELFTEALSWIIHLSDSEFKKLKEAARQTSQKFKIEDSVQHLLGTYKNVCSLEYVSRDRPDSAWYTLMSRIKTEWDMFKNVVQASSAAVINDKPLTDQASNAAVVGDKPLTSPTIPIYKDNWLLRLRRWLSQWEWTVGLLGLSKSEEANTEPGLVMIQIDGFSLKEFKSTLEKGEMPFLSSLLNKEGYQTHPLFAGLPSSTPSVQGELFYGVKQIVPAFSFWDPPSSKIFRLFDGEDAIEIERRLAAHHNPPLLEGGSSYSNVYRGGAKEAHFCASVLGWQHLWKDVNPFNFCLFVLTHFMKFLRILFLMALEFLLSIIDFLYGLFKKQNFKKELTFIPLRVSICILLRELITLGAKIDIARGLPIIHMNFLGYDEQAHHRGPSSFLAHWSLKGIDNAIKKIYHKALRSSRRNYDVWIYSDHGQEEVISYPMKYGRPVQEAITEVFKDLNPKANVYSQQEQRGIQAQRVQYMGVRWFKKFLPIDDLVRDLAEEKIIVTTIGPTGNIYIHEKLSDGQKRQFAQELVRTAKIPIVVTPEGEDKARVWNAQGEFLLPDDGEKVFDESHPFYRQVIDDLIRLCRHPAGGTFTFLGWQKNGPLISFPIERGAHGGVGPLETQGFTLLPSDIVKAKERRPYLRPIDLRQLALRFLNRHELPPEFPFILTPPFKKPETIRIMTYNVHSCIGMDGKISVERIARVIGRHEPDIVALQELDLQRPRTKGIDQPHRIAKQLEMLYHFHPLIRVAEEQYGTAILSRYPMELIRAGRLPSLFKNPRWEARGVIWTAISIGDIELQFINTHLSFFPPEGVKQAKTLLGKEWIGHSACAKPLVLCGDFNALPNSFLCRQMKGPLCDAVSSAEKVSSKATWFSHYPVGRLDHVFLSPGIKVKNVEVSRTGMDKIASDHLPLIVDIYL